jgi:hypothetical protein
MANFKAQPGTPILGYEKKMDTNDSDTILEIKGLITAQKKSPLPISNHNVSP